MASLQKHPGTRFWRCSFFDPNLRKWRLVSTGCEDKVEAMAVCARMEALTKLKQPEAAGAVPADAAGELVEAGLRLVQKAAKGELNEAVGREFINRLLKASAMETIEGETTAAFLDSWLDGKKVAKAQRTAERYRTPVERFKTSLGKRANLSLASITKADVEKFRKDRLTQVSEGTLESDFKILKGIFERARKQGVLIGANPFELVEIAKGDRIEKLEREALTAGEVDLLVAAAPSDEWKTTILLGFYCGMRLGDAVLLEWDAVDFEKGTIAYKASKSRRKMEIPLHPKLMKHLDRIAGDKGGKVSPTLASIRVPGRSGLSLQFLDILKAAGLDAGQKESTSGRKFSSRSFHSLRHGFISAMANQGVAPELRQKLAGHRSKDVHSKYTHLELETLRKAVRKIK
jgi:integrase